ncbi:hypothetical protein Pogu_0795 [Pyrobaculum oguniense TE7]|uniref:DUF86 domain-containing protein n=1 Tax=Pyrobaculum oguniense (strain DSM 13380 / JCM 10595 / TE7) TaxID=698757 RepID=H6Q892_PYROT|nr:hypothetical protein Pogu_0795 [Pyrobaculum oguniense TE7]
MDALQRLRRQLELIRAYAAELGEERSSPGVERLEQLIIQALLDLGAMAPSALGAPPARSYGQIGYELYRRGALSKEDAAVLRAMAGLRNIHVHGYAAVEPEKVVECSKRVGQDALRIAEAIISALEGRGINPLEEEAVAKIRDVLRGRVRLAYLFGGGPRGTASRGTTTSQCTWRAVATFTSSA